jgi:hypothetical protein
VQRYKSGLLIARRWSLGGQEGSQLTETITVSSATGKPIAVWFQDSIPAAIASTVQGVRFSPRSARIVKSDPVVEWYLRVPARGTVTVGYVAAVPPEGASTTRLARWATGLDTIEAQLNTPPARHPRPTRSPTLVSPTVPAPSQPSPTSSPANPNPYPTYTCNPVDVTCSTKTP